MLLSSLVTVLFTQVACVTTAEDSAPPDDRGDSASDDSGGDTASDLPPLVVDAIVSESPWTMTSAEGGPLAVTVRVAKVEPAWLSQSFTAAVVNSEGAPLRPTSPPTAAWWRGTPA